MATIKNIIQTVFTSQGARRTADDVDHLGRAQTRLGQASASAGRSFAAQAQGMGGLVAAYAGAAATTFALQQAYDKLAKSARAAQTLQGLTSIAATAAIDGNKLLSSVQSLTKNQLTLVQAAEQTNLALSAGFNSKQIEGLSVVALKASRALGRDLTDAMTRVVRGSAKMETELLDELGIYTKIEPATRAYAAALNKSVSSLSEYERRQAFVNAVIAEGNKKFSSINTIVPTSAEKIEAFGAKIVDLSQQLGMLLADTLAPLADFLTNNTAAAFSTLGIAISLVAGRGLTLLSDAFATMTTRIEQGGIRAELFVRSLFGLTKRANEATQAIVALDQSTLRLNNAEQASLQTILSNAQARALTRSEIAQTSALIAKSVTSINNESAALTANRNALISQINAKGVDVTTTRAAFDAAKVYRDQLVSTGAAATQVAAAETALASARGKLGAATRAFNAAQGQQGVVLEQTRNKILNLNADAANLENTNRKLEAATKARGAGISSVFSATARSVSAISSGFTAMLTGIVGLASKLMFISSIFTLIGSSIANAIGKGEEFEAFVSSLSQTIKGLFSNETRKNAKNVFQGIAAGALNELEKVNSELSGIESYTFKEKFLFFDVKITKTKQELVSEVSNLLADASQGFEKAISDSATSGKAVGGAFVGGMLGSLLTLIPGIGPLLGPTVGRAIGGAIGFGIGTIWDYFSDIPSVPEEVSRKLKLRFSEALAGFDSATEDKIISVLAKLDDKYGAAAKIDPSARAALKLQQELVFASAKYLDNVEAISQIMVATGKDAAAISKDFRFDKAVDNISFVSKAIISVGNTDLNFRFIDTLDKGVEETLNSINRVKNGIIDMQELTSRVELLGGDAFNVSKEELSRGITTAFNTVNQLISDYGLNTEAAINEAMLKLSGDAVAKGVLETLGKDIVNLENAAGTLLDSYMSLDTSINAISNSGIRVAEILKSTKSALLDNSLSFEQYTQNISNAQGALIDAQRELPNLRKELSGYLADMNRYDMAPDKRAEAEKLYNATKARVQELEKTLELEDRILKGLEGQTEEYQRQIKFSEFIKNQTKETINEYEQGLKIAQAGQENATLGSLQYFNSFIQGNTAQAIEEFNALKDTINSLGTDLKKEEISAILAASSGGAKDLAANLKAAGVDAKFLRDGVVGVSQSFDTPTGIKTFTTELVLQSGEFLKLATEGQGAYDAMRQILVDNLQKSAELLKSASYINKAQEAKNALLSMELSLKQQLANEQKQVLAYEIASANAQLSLTDLEREVTLLTAELEVSKTLADIQKSTSEARIEAIEYETARSKELSDQRISDLEREADIVQSRFSTLLARNEIRFSVTSPEQDATKVKLTMQQAAAQLQSELQIIEEKRKQAQIEFDSQKKILGERSAIAERERQDSIRVYEFTKEQNQLQKKIREAQQSAEQKALAEEIRQANAKLNAEDGILAKQKELETKKIENEYELLKKQETANLTNVRDNLAYLDSQKLVNDNLLKGLETYLQILKDNGNITISVDSQGTANFSTLISDLDARIGVVGSEYDALKEQALDLARTEIDLERQKTESARNTAQSKLAANAIYFNEYNTLLDRQDRAEEAAALQSVFRASDVAAQQLKALEDLEAKGVESVDSTEKAWLQYSSTVLGVLAQIASAVVNINEGLRAQKLELQQQADLSAITRQQTSERVAFENRSALRNAEIANAQAQLTKLQAQQALDAASTSKSKENELNAAKARLELEQAISEAQRSQKETSLGNQIEDAQTLKALFDDMSGPQGFAGSVMSALNLYDAQYKLAELQVERERESYENELQAIDLEKQLLEAKKSASGANIRAIEEQQKVERNIFELQQQQAADERAQAVKELESSIALLKAENEINVAKAKQEETVARQNLAVQKAQLQASKDNLIGLNKFAEAMATVFFEGAAAVADAFDLPQLAASIRNKLNEVTTQFDLGNAEESVNAAFRDAESLISKGESLLTSLYGGVIDTPAGLKEVQGKVFSELELNFNSQLNNLETQKTTLEEVNTLAENTAKLQKEALELQQKAAVAQSTGEAQSIEAELTALRQRQVEASKALLAAEETLIREKFKLAAEVLTSIVKSVGKLLTDNKQEEINKLKLQESIISQSLATTTENLSKAQERQKESLSKEISLRDELKAATESLTEKQKEYISALTGDDRSIVESSNIFIKTLLEQKKKAIDLSKTISERLRLDTQVKSLEEKKVELEYSLESATKVRVEAENQLANLQQTLGVVTEIASGKLAIFINQVKSFIASMGGMSGFSMGSLVQSVGSLLGVDQIVSLFNPNGMIAKAANKLFNAGDVLTKAGSSVASAVGANGKVSSSFIGPMPKAGGAAGAAGAAGGFWGTVGSAIGGAFQGFGIGQLVGALTKDPGMGSSIGGAIGGAIGTIFASQLVTAPIIGALATGIGSALGIAANFIIPGIGAVLGAIVGRFFSKTPKAGARGQLTEEGYTTTSTYQRKVPGGTANSLSDIAGNTLGGMVDSLKAAGIAFKDVVNTSIDLRKNSITGASLEFAGGARFEKGGSGTSQKDLEGVAQFYLDSFVKGLRQGSLVVDDTIANAKVLQEALDNFVSSSVDSKTIDRLKNVIDYANNFSKILDSLGEAVPVTMGDAIAQVTLGAKQNATQLADYYKGLKDQAAENLGAASDGYKQLTKAISDNALAQLGLAKGSDGVVRVIDSAVQQLNAGELAITNIIESIASSAAFLRQAGDNLQDIAGIVDLALNAQVGKFVGDIGKTLQQSIDILKNPAKQSVIELQSIIDNADARNTQMQGIVKGIQSSTARLNASQLDTAIENVAKAVELGALEVETYISSLSIAQLKAVVADENLTDARAKTTAQTRLAEMEEADRATALKNFIKISRDFNKSLAEISNTASTPQFAQSSTSSVEIAQMLGKAKTDEVSSNLADMVNNIAKGKDILDNFNGTIQEVNNLYATGAVTATQYTDVLSLLADTTTDSLQVLSELVTAFEDTAQEIADIYTGLQDTLVSAADDVSTTITDLLDTFKTKSLDILKIYDTTLRDVATSGNEILDLRDTAKQAFETAAQAVAEFEKANNLSGKSSAQIGTQISDIQKQLDSLQAKPFDFASFLEFGKLSSQQRALQSELKTVVEKEQEYSKLLKAREIASGDVAFAESTVLTLGDKLVDSRRSESETIQKIQDATVSFTKSQEELKAITELLAAANFDLNVARFDEENRVIAVGRALNDLSKVSSELVTEVNGIDAAFKEVLLSGAKSSAEIKYAALSEAERTKKIKEATDQVDAYYNQLLAVAPSIRALAQPFTDVADDIGTTLTKVLTDTDYVGFAAQLTDRFKGFSENLVQYLDTDGLALFYGPGGKFEQFSQSLKDTLILQGFDILTASGGPLAGFRATFGAVALVFDDLAKNGAFLDTVLTSIKGTFGQLVTGLGLTAEGIKSYVQVLITDTAASLNAAPVSLNLGEGVGKLINEYILSLDNVKSYTALTLSVEEADTLGWMVQTYLRNIDSATSYDALALSTATGVGLSIQTFLNSLKTYSGFTAPTITADAGIGKAIGDFFANISTSAYVSASATSGIGKAVQAWLDSFNSGTSKLTAPVFSASSGIGGSVQTFLNALKTSGSYAAPTADSRLAGNIANAVQTFFTALSSSTTYAAPTVSTTSGSKSVGEMVQNFLKAIDTFAYTAPTVTTTTGLGKKVSDYLAGLDTNVTLQATAQTGLGAAIQKFITTLGTANTYTGLAFSTTTNGSLGQVIQSFLTAIGSSTTYVAPTLSTTAGAGGKVQETINAVNTVKYIAPTLSTTTGIGSVVQGLINSIVSATIFTAPKLVTTAGAPLLIQNYLTGIEGVEYTTPTLAVTKGPAKRIDDYIKSIDTFTGYTTPTLSTTAGLGKSIQGYIDSIKNTLTPAIGGIADVFTADRTSKITAFKDAVAAIDTAGTNITASKDVLAAINGIVTNGGNAGTKIADLSTKLGALSTVLSPLLDTVSGRTLVKGQLSVVKDSISQLATDIQTAWSAVKFNAETNLGKSISVAVTGGGLSSQDSTNLSTIATNSAKYPAIDATGLKYKTANFATGGYVAGPGSGTSDSIPANLSNGEYVMKASATRRLGKNLLDTLNATGDLNSTLSGFGRRGDSLLAHINPQEAALLKRMGGSGTINPKTGLLEFFNKDAGAFGGLFQTQEVDKLLADHQSGVSGSIAPTNLPGFIRMDVSGSGSVYPYNPGQIFSLFGGDSTKAAAAMRIAGNSLSLADKSLEARDQNSLRGLSFGIGAANAPENNIVLGYDNGSTSTIPNDKVGSGSTRGGYAARPNQLLSALATGAGQSVTDNTTGLSKNALTKYVTGLNSGDGKLFFDFYMLDNKSSAAPVRTSILGNAPGQAEASRYEQSYADGKYFESARMADSVTNSAGAYTYIEDVSKATSNAIANPFGQGGAMAGTLEGAGVGIFAPSAMFGYRPAGTNGFASVEEFNKYVVSLVGGSGTDINAAITSYVEQMKQTRINEILSSSGVSAVAGETFEQSIQRLIAKRTEEALLAQQVERARLAALSDAQRQLEERVSAVYLNELGTTIPANTLASYVSNLYSGATTIDRITTDLRGSAAGQAWQVKKAWLPVYNDRVSAFNLNPSNIGTQDGRPALASLDTMWNLRSGKTLADVQSDVANYWKVKSDLALAGPKASPPVADITGISQFVLENPYRMATTMAELTAEGLFRARVQQGLYETPASYASRGREWATKQYGADTPLYSYLVDKFNLSKYAAGGLVGNGRDRIPALLEPGEFVLRKQAVDSMGIDNAIRLNSTGNMGGNGDIEVEVNINNNGTSQTAVGTPAVRRENGKIVVDIILEDLRNNGPINRQIRSIR